MAVTDGFGALLRRLRIAADLTQEELAERATLSPRSISALERGVNLTARRDTARLLADALDLSGAQRAAFEMAARGRVAPGEPTASQTQSGTAAAVRTLPRDIGSFTGREPEMRELIGAAQAGALFGIHAIGGMAGVGKTAFAVHLAHELAPRFPDGQVFLPLHGHTPGQQPVDPADALVSLLLVAGVAASQIPPGLPARMAKWRDHLAGKQLLLLLDDAVGSEQIRPLLPGTAESLVLVTSRRHLTALDDAKTISLDALPPMDAIALLVKLAGRPDLDGRDPSIAEIAATCGYLPLAVGMLARQLHHHPTWTPADLAADLAAARDRLEFMAAENLSVAAAFDLSYRDLSATQQVLFKRLGLHPGPDIDLYAATALNDGTLPVTRRDLDGLYDHYLLGEPTRGRYVFHDLIREYARALVATDPQDRGDAAISHLLDYYVCSLQSADSQIPRRVPRITPSLTVTAPTCKPEHAAFADAIAWLDAERLNLFAACGLAVAHGWPAHAVAIANAIHGYLRHQGYWDEARSLHQTALGAARQTSDRAAEASLLADLGDMQILAGEWSAAISSLQLALKYFRDLADQVGQAVVLDHLGYLQRTHDEPQAALASLTQALEHYRNAHSKHGEASALISIGAAKYALDECEAAESSLTRALRLYRELRDPNGQANALLYLGAVYHTRGEYPAAADVLSRALELHRELGNQLGEANAMTNLGSVKHESGDHAGAVEYLRASLQLHRELGNQLGVVTALTGLGAVHLTRSNTDAATSSLVEALKISRRIDDRSGEGHALGQLGALHHALGDQNSAVVELTRALELAHESGNRLGEAQVLNTLGQVSLAAAAPAQARVHYEKALSLAAEIPSPLEEARALEGIGQCLLLDGQPRAAAGCLRQALAIHERIGTVPGMDVRKSLGELPD